MQLLALLAAGLATGPIIAAGSVTFDVYVGADQPGECTGEELGTVTQGAGDGNLRVFENAACIQVESVDACCTVALYHYPNCTQQVGSLNGATQGDILQVDFACIKVACGDLPVS